jgi:ABC-type Mn2+/Zn2+ transport system ATPase subunit
MSADILRCDDVTVCYGRTPAVHHLSAELRCGTLVALMGPNGAGKSTLLRAMLGWQALATGRITIAGAALARARSRIGYLPQRSLVDWDFPLRVRDVVEMGRFPRRGAFAAFGAEDAQLIDGALAEMGLSAVQDRHIAALSGGQQQRTLLARALSSGADIVLLDEPFVGLDAVSTADLVARLQAWAGQGRLVIAAMHDIDLARRHFHQALLIRTHLIACGPVAEALSARHLAEAYGPAYLTDPAVGVTAAPGHAPGAEDRR